MQPRRAAKRARPAEADEGDAGQQQLQQPEQQPEQQQLVVERRASARLAALPSAADAAPAPAPPALGNNNDDDDPDALATERASDPTGFAGLDDDDDHDDGSVVVEQRPPPSSRRRTAAGAAAAAAAGGGDDNATAQQQLRKQQAGRKKARRDEKARPAAAADAAAAAPAAAAPPPAPPPPQQPPSAAPPPNNTPKKLSPLALTLYVRWWAPDGLKTRVHEIPLRALGSADDLRGLPRELVRRLFGVPPSVPADAPIAQRLPPHASGPDFYRFTPAGGREFLSVPGPIAAFEVRLVVAAGGWEHTIADRGGGGLGGPGDVVVAVTEFESPPVDLGPGALPGGLPRALLPMLRLPLIAYPLVCVRRSFLDRVERMLTDQQRAQRLQRLRDTAAALGVAPPPPRPLPGADHPGAGAAGVGGAVAFCADAVASFDGRCAAGVAASLGRPDGGRGLGAEAAPARERAAVRPIVPLL
jgi:hypothetical protein